MIFRDIHLTVSGGGTPKDATRQIPELIDVYPDAFSFGTTPAYGFWIRHASRLTFDQVKITSKKADARPEFRLGAETSEVRVNGESLSD